MNAPVCLDAERRVLGSLIVFHAEAPTLLARVQATGLKPADFWYRSHEAVYRAVLRLDHAGEHVNDLTVGRFLAGQRHSRAVPCPDCKGAGVLTAPPVDLTDPDYRWTCSTCAGEGVLPGTWLAAVGGQAKVEELAGCADLNGCVPCARMCVEDARFRRWLVAMQDGIEAIYSRDESAFWDAMGKVRGEKPASGLKLVEGEAAA